MTAVGPDGSVPLAGVALPSGGSAWANGSDRNRKTAFQPIDSRAILEQVAQLPISTWQYRSQDTHIRHMGPVAQDFYAAFGLGSSDTSITTVDADGVALAAIQGLNELLQEQDTTIATLEQQNAELRRQFDTQQQQIDALQQQIDALQQ